MRKTLLLGYIALTLAQVFFAGNLVINKYLIAQMDMFVFLVWRFIFATIAFGAVFGLTRARFVEPTHPEQRITTADYVSCALQGLFAGFLFNILFCSGLKQTTATAAGIICSTLPALIAVFAVWFLKEYLGRTKIIALCLAMLGILFINLDQFSETTQTLDHTLLGDLLIFLAMLPEAWYSILSRKMGGRITPLGSAFLTNIFALIIILPFGFKVGAFNFGDFSTLQYVLLFLAGISSLIFYWGWAWGLSFISASTAGLFAGVLPVATTGVAVLFLGERLHWFDLAGILLVLSSIVIGTKLHQRFLRKPSLVLEPEPSLEEDLPSNETAAS